MKNSIKNICKIVFFFWTICLVMQSCAEDSGLKPARVGEKPDKLTNIQFKSIPGGAILSYDLPKNTDLRYVKAIYSLKSGVERIAKASIFDNKIRVDGFATEGKYTVKLQAVSLGEVESDPSTVEIQVNTPRYILVAQGFKDEENLYGTFGGLNLHYFNEDRNNLVITVLRKNNLNRWDGIDTVYTKEEQGIFRIRGELPTTNTYGVVVRDQWDNVSDTIVSVITPIEETRLTKDYLKIFPMRAYTDAYTDGDFIRNWASQAGSADMISAFTDRSGSNLGNLWWGKGAPIPFSFTLDLGANVLLSRLKMWARNDNERLLFQATHVKEFEVYGSNNPNPNGAWDVWEKIGTFESSRPSGLPFGTNPTVEDIAYAKAGEDFEIDSENNKTYRYMRIKVLCTWNQVREAPIENPLTVSIAEFEIFGQIK